MYMDKHDREMRFEQGQGDSDERRSGKRVVHEVDLGQPFTDVVAVVTGYSAQYDPENFPNAGDHHFGRLEVGVRADPIEGTTSTRVTGTLLLHDWTRNAPFADDPWSGSISYRIVAV